MSTLHRVEQGEYLAGIARRYGFVDYRTIYDHPDNAEFKRKRPDPSVIYAGDEIVIPDKEVKEETAATEALHRFHLASGSVRLRILLKSSELRRLRNKRYTLVIGTDTYEGTTDGDGVMDEQLPADAREGDLTLWDGDPPAPACSWRILIAHLDPVDEVTGFQARLNNLGFDCGPVDGIVGPLTRAGVRAYQAAHPPLEVDGVCGPRTQARLKEVYGC